MSPLWRDEVVAFVGPRQVVLSRMRRGLKPRRVADWAATLEQADLCDWSPALETLDVELRKSEWRDANLRVVIADQWAHYGIVPWSAELRGEEERLSHAGIVMRHTYAGAVDQWTLSVSDAFPGSARIVSALPTQLLQALRSQVSAPGLRLISTQPQLIVAYNAWRYRLPATGGWFVTLDEGSLAALHWSDQGWDQVRSVRISDNWQAELRRLQAFGRLARGNPAGVRIYVDAPRAIRLTTLDGDPGIEWLEEEEGSAATLDRVALVRGMYA